MNIQLANENNYSSDYTSIYVDGYEIEIPLFEDELEQETEVETDDSTTLESDEELWEFPNPDEAEC